MAQSEMGTVTLYIRKEFEPTWEAFMKVCASEGESGSASRKLENWVQDFMTNRDALGEEV